MKGAGKTTIGELNATVMLGGARIASGDIVVLDADGGVSIKPERMQAVLEAAESRLERESRLREKLIAGQMSYDLHGLRDYIENYRKA